MCAPTPPRTNWLIFILKVAFICELGAVVRDCGLYFMVCGCKYAARQDNLLQDQTGSGYCTFYLGKIKPGYAEWSFWLRRSWKLEMNRAPKVSGLIERTWKFAEIVVRGAPSPVVLVHFCPQINKEDSFLTHDENICTQRHLLTRQLSLQSAITVLKTWGNKGSRRASDGTKLH